MELSEPEPVDDLLVVDQDGDVILEVRNEYSGPVYEGPVQILAASEVLITSSPVFRVMLCGHFAEAQLPFNMENPPTVRLPEDSPSAAILFCQLVHPTILAPALAREINYHALPGLLEFCDKYNSLGSIHPWLRPELEQLVKEKTRLLGKEMGTKMGFAGLTHLSYLLHDPELFRVATASLIYYHSPEDFCSDLAVCGAGIKDSLQMKERLLDTLNKAQEAYVQRLRNIGANALAATCYWPHNTPMPNAVAFPAHNVFSADRDLTTLYLCKGQANQLGVVTASLASSSLLPAPAFSRLNPAKNWGWNADQQRLETLVNGLKTVMNISPVLQQLLCHQSGCDACRRTVTT